MSSLPTKPKEIRKFGLVGLVFFGLLAAAAVWRHRPTALGVFGGLVFLMLAFIGAPGLMSPVYRAWMKVAEAIGKVMNALILSLAFFIVISPFALLKRWFRAGGPALPRKPDPAAETYWVKREIPAQARRQFLRRY